MCIRDYELNIGTGKCVAATPELADSYKARAIYIENDVSNEAFDIRVTNTPIGGVTYDPATVDAQCKLFELRTPAVADLADATKFRCVECLTLGKVLDTSTPSVCINKHGNVVDNCANTNVGNLCDATAMRCTDALSGTAGDFGFLIIEDPNTATDGVASC